MNNINHKYVIEVLRKVSYAYELDNRNNNTLWVDAIKKDMKNVRGVFGVKERDTKIDVGHSYLD